MLNRPVGRAVTRSSQEREVDLRFEFRAGQIGHSVANGSPPLQHFFERKYAARRRNDAEMGPANSLHASAYYNEYDEKFDLVFHFDFQLK